MSCPASADDISDCVLDHSDSCASGMAATVTCSGGWSLDQGASKLEGLLKYRNGFYCGSLDDTTADYICASMGFGDHDSYELDQDTHNGIFTGFAASCDDSGCDLEDGYAFCESGDGVSLKCRGKLQLVHGTSESRGLLEYNSGFVCGDDFR